jgi:hypothetical protein
MPLVNNGYVVPTPAQRLTQVQQAFINAYGSNFNLDGSTPQGLLIQELTNQFIDIDNQYLALVNSLNPNIATGQALDAIAQFDYINRNPATNTQVTCEVTGLEGVQINQGAIVLDTNNNEYRAVGNIIIDNTGNATGLFEAVQSGAIVASANTVNRIYQQQTGWDSVNNSSAGTTGTPIEPDYAFRPRRKIAIFRGTQLVEAMNATINSIVSTPVVQCGLVLNNSSNSTIAGGKYGTITIPVGYICIVILGGANVDIANWLYQYITGVGTVGSRVITVTPPAPPIIPSYTCNVFTPAIKDLFITINANVPAGSSANLRSLIQSAIYDDYTTNRVLYPLIGQKVTNWQFAQYVNAIAVSTNTPILINSIYVGDAINPADPVVEADYDHALLINAIGNIVVNLTLI